MEKNMQVNFDHLKERVVDALNKTDLEYIRYELSKLKEPTIISGVGGSSVVSEFGAKVLNQKNKIIATNSEPRDFIYRNNNGFKNVISCSYSGNNYGVDLAFAYELQKYLLSNNPSDKNEVINLTYNTTIDKERSFISLGATLIPVSVFLNYYDKKMVPIEESTYDFKPKGNIYEIFTGYDTSTAAKYLESTLVEAGIGIPIIHDKYSFCHGRSTFNIIYPENCIYFNRNTEFDLLMLEELKQYFPNIIIIESKYQDQVLDDYQMLIQAMYLTKYLAELQNKDLSKVEYSPIVKKLYKYNGEI